MSKQTLPAAKAVQFESAVLENGLTVYVHTKADYATSHAIFGTKFGSVNRLFNINGKQTQLPAGIAHFLEHKMFESEQGDAFELYAKTGASANAYTSFDKTCYIFTASSKIDENLDILLSFVSSPYFTDKTVKKEQGIIGQEIKMYDDAVHWQLLVGALRCMYKNHFIKDDIAGTTQSIAEITPEMLYMCTDAFYNPENMVLAIAGNVTIDQVKNACERANIKPKNITVSEVEVSEPLEIVQKELVMNMAVSKTQMCIAFKETPPPKNSQEVLKCELICDMITEVICGNMTPLYRKLYDENLVSPGFSGDYLCVDGALCFLFSGESNEPDKVKNLLIDEIDRMRKQGVDKELFTLCKNLMYGEMVCDLENVDDIATGLANIYYRGYTRADAFEILASLTVKDINDALQNLLHEQNSVTVKICKK